MQVHGGQLSLTFLYTPWVDKHAGKNRINLLSAVRKISLKEGGHVLAKKYIDTLNSSSVSILVSLSHSVTHRVSHDLHDNFINSEF